MLPIPLRLTVNLNKGLANDWFQTSADDRVVAVAADAPGGKQQGSQARRRVEIHGPKARSFGKSEQVFDGLIEIWPDTGGVSTISPAKMHLPAP
jgi:hypothetical protein